MAVTSHLHLTEIKVSLFFKQCINMQILSNCILFIVLSIKCICMRWLIKNQLIVHKKFGFCQMKIYSHSACYSYSWKIPKPTLLSCCLRETELKNNQKDFLSDVPSIKLSIRVIQILHREKNQLNSSSIQLWTTCTDNKKCIYIEYHHFCLQCRISL